MQGFSRWISFGLAMATMAAAVADEKTAPPTERLTVAVDRPGIRISPVFYGLMTEEINHSYDGGLYGELIQNRSFRDNPQSPRHWSVVAEGGGVATTMLEGTPTTLRLDVTTPGTRVGIANDGYWGIPVKPHTTYRAAFVAKASAGFKGAVEVDIESADGNTVLASGQSAPIGPEWHEYDFTLRTGDLAPSQTNRFVLSTRQAGTVWFGEVSLFPPTYHSRKNGNRIDLMDLLADLKPRFLRLPGGNYLEGNTIPERFEWKDTIGEAAKRPGHQGPWGYRSSDGLGLLEFLEWCEDLHMQPVLAVFAGYSLRQQHVAPGPDLAPYVQDALDEIEYVTGSTDTKWGAERAKDGHPRPFPLTYIEVGNEDNFDRSNSYDGRFAQFYDAIKAKYPTLQLIATMPIRSRKPDLVDDHYYRSAADMERDVHHYDAYDRKGPKIFVGEWASTMGSPTPTMEAALGDAAWLTGLEKNSDLVVMESYAPLLVNVNPGARQWPTNLIGYDALKSFGSPAYYVQSMFAKNAGDIVLPTELDVAPPAAKPVAIPHGAIGVGTYRTDAEFRNIQVTSDGKSIYAKDFRTGADGWSALSGTWATDGDVYRQTGGRPSTLATAGDTAWTNYSYHLQARKLGGAEGFLIYFHVHDAQNYWVWNVGGWGDTRTAIQRREQGSTDEVGRAADVTIETGRWYDVRIDVQNGKVQCYLDGRVVSEAREEPRPPAEPMYATASRDLSNGDVILKVVNASGDPHTLEVSLPGAPELAPVGESWVLAGSPQDVNTLDQPLHIAPRRVIVSNVAGRFPHEFPPYSVTVMRLRRKE